MQKPERKVQPFSFLTLYKTHRPLRKSVRFPLKKNRKRALLSLFIFTLLSHVCLIAPQIIGTHGRSKFSHPINHQEFLFAQKRDGRCERRGVPTGCCRADHKPEGVDAEWRSVAPGCGATDLL
ncbi:hypothetical protein CDAR_409021 [Caerostris darwini]|uniref:Transmembrane protein n=1 Tax=Caerostris darwini TaxID=1538125 RepID=A0AAV4P8F2_9ARAC|nr:hypothetical protein CDAR_409021 [Caerostris darwini]